jgi:hypothetical protein
VISLAPVSAPASEIPNEMTDTFRNYLNHSAHVVLVCEIQKTLHEAPSRNRKHQVHVTAIVVRTIKGEGVIGDRIRYYRQFESDIPGRALELGNLTFLMLQEYGPDEFLLGTGEGWSYTSELDTLLASIQKETDK